MQTIKRYLPWILGIAAVALIWYFYNEAQKAKATAKTVISVASPYDVQADSLDNGGYDPDNVIVM